MKTIALSFALVLASCADLPDDSTRPHDADQQEDGAPDLSVATEAVQAFVTPDSVEIQGRIEYTSPVTWAVSREYFGKLFDEASTLRGYYTFGQNGVGPSATSLPGYANCTHASQAATFTCDGVIVNCPTIDYGNSPDPTYPYSAWFTTSRGGYVGPAWYYGDLSIWTVYYGSNALNPVSGTMQGSAHHWQLNCLYPFPSNYYILQYHRERASVRASPVS